MKIVDLDKMNYIPTNIVWCHYLSIPLIPAANMQVPIYPAK